MRIIFFIYWTLALVIWPQYSRADVIPHPVGGYEIRLLAQNLGEVKALAIIGNDIFVLDQRNERILRLRDQDLDGSFDMQTVYLVGFTHASHMVAHQNHLFISDANGIWKASVGKNLTASQAPTNIVPFTPRSPSPLAVNKSGLYAGVHTATFKGIVEIRMDTNAVITFAKTIPEVQALTISPTGQLWAALKMNTGTHVTKISHQDIFGAHPLKTNVFNITITDMRLWQGKLLLAQSRPTPKITQQSFAYGELTGKEKPLISEFSIPSIRVGKVDILGIPSAMAILENGNLLFADKINGNIWSVSKTQIQTDKPKEIQSTPLLQDTLTKPDVSISSKPPALLSGSSITSASSLPHGSTIRKDELLKNEKRKETPKSPQ